MTDLLTLENIHKVYETQGEDLTVLTGVNLTVKSASRVAIVGQSGSGKSTLLHIAGLLDVPSTGRISVCGEDLTQAKDLRRSHMRASRFGFVYQEHHLMKDFTALENVMMPNRFSKRLSTDAARERAEGLLRKVGLEDRMYHKPHQMSGGEQQRVSIARALMNQPQILLADEPTGNLDPHTAESVFSLLESLVKTENMALLMVTHNHALAEACDCIYVMEEGHLSAISSET